MKITIKKTTDLMTPSLEVYIQEKLMPLAKFVKHFDEKGEAEILLEVSRTTQHHQKGDVFMAAADLRLPHKILRGESTESDIHIAIDRVRDTLHLEIEKYKTQFMEHQRGKEK